MQTIVFPWLVTVVLHEPARRVGIAQMSLMALSILFMMLGGAVADRATCGASSCAVTFSSRCRRCSSPPPSRRAGCPTRRSSPTPSPSARSAPSSLPARDAMLRSRVAGQDYGRAVAIMTATQFAAQPWVSPRPQPPA